MKLPMLLEMDNKGTVDLANNWSIGGHTRHIDVQQCFLCIVYLLLTYGVHTHKARCSDLAYLVTRSLLTPLLGREWIYVQATVHSSSHQAMMQVSDQLHTTSF
jgi:hypothetical protein